ncbi:MAG: ATP-dependent transcriptional regulator, MalT-like, LuxR family [Actinomycetia bacterium]|nr:ATP-dependent transcriptional regulator, MalT-like, LuxR family [Actinomycetes bacterium]
MGPLLETKLHIPRRPAARVARPRLSERMGGDAPSTLTLVSAPAGFGKTTVLTEWLDSLPAGLSRAWLSLDPRDNDSVSFWTYVVAALRTAAGNAFGAATLSLLQSSQAPLDAVIATLLNELTTVSDDVVLVLDDYHVIEAPDVHESVAYLLDRLPAPIHLVIATRADPPLPLGRLRVDGRMTEIRAADLRFTAGETEAYLERSAGATLSAADIASLAERTEGWVAALQLATLSMQGRDDTSSFIAEFAGDDRYIVDYLVEEVLDRQTEDVRRFLLQTSILDRMNGSLCDAVTGQDSGKATLERLERANMFLVPLDDRRHWYRYHHLFADVLKAHLLDEQRDAVAGLNGRASRWYELHGEPTEGIRHALAAGDFSRAADLVEAALPAWSQDRQETTGRTWLQRLPDDVVRVRPALLVGLVGALAAIGDFEGAQERLDDAERLLRSAAAGAGRTGPDAVIVDETQLRSLPAAIEMYRAALALSRGDLDGTETHGRRVLDIAPEDDHLERAAAAALVGLAAWARGDLDAAFDGYSQCVTGLRRAGHIADILGCSITLADLRIAQGRLGDALRIYTEALELGTGTGTGGVPLRGTADMHVGLSEVHHERGNEDAAMEHLRRSSELGEHNGLPQHPYRSRLAMARLRQSEGDVAAAVALLDEAERVYTTDFSPSVRPIPAVRAGLLATHGNVGDAMAWVRERGLSTDDDLDYLSEFEHITLARVLLARSRTEPSDRAVDETVRLLERLLGAAEAGGRIGAVLQILVLLALAEDARGDRPAAVAHLDRALILAEPEGYVRLFLDESPWMQTLLGALAERGTSAAYIDRLLQGTTDDAPHRPGTQPLVDPLSNRELDVLRLLGSDLTGPEIARELMVSLNTMRTHTKNIYAKLGVTSRRAAVTQAEALQLLAHRNRG